jgi:hypothetical protein
MGAFDQEWMGMGMIDGWTFGRRPRTRADVLLAVSLGMATSATGAGGQLPWNGDAWRIQAEESRVESHLGREALFLRNGTAWMDATAFSDGVIEFDLAVSAEQGFHGVRFRAVDDNNHEHIYLRPHLSDKPDATQYNPIFNGVSSWQLFTDARYIQPLVIPTDRWVHVRVGIGGDRVELRLDGGDPIIFPEMVRESVVGPVGITSSAAPAWFANVQVRPGADPELSNDAGAPPVDPPAGSVLRWSVSEPFAEDAVDGVNELPRSLAAGLRWTLLDSETNGLANLARVSERSDEGNTVFAALTLDSEAARTVAATIAFSDRVRVFLNGRQLYAGADGYASRDYRFLGSMGFFDTVFLPLREGKNELWMAVSEDFGGWGVALALPPDAPISVVDPRGP